jgi:hypothetical protein
MSNTFWPRAKMADLLTSHNLTLEEHARHCGFELQFG